MTSPFTIAAAHSPTDLDAVRALMRTYGDTPDVSVCVVDFDKEMAGLPGPYAEPGGTILLARVSGAPAGCVALKPVAPGVAEIKRLFVRAEFRGRQIGAALASGVIDAARARGYDVVRLDTLPSMTEARALYSRLGFTEVAPWEATPPPGVGYFELTVASAFRRKSSG